MTQNLLFARELRSQPVLKCRERLLNLPEFAETTERQMFGTVCHGPFFGLSNNGWTGLMDCLDGSKRGEVAIRDCNFSEGVKKYLCANLDGEIYEAGTTNSGPVQLWSADFYFQGSMIGALREIERDKTQGWFRRLFASRHRMHIHSPNGELIAEFAFQYPVDKKTIINLEIVSDNDEIVMPVSLGDAFFSNRASRAIVGIEIDGLNGGLSRELCFVVALWMRFQLFQLHGD